ncbi:MAG TPA: hypothetical protein DCQ04_04300 [Actinobacteria bacterium]|nr:hypothetical protein [Actinomycetota bacterium]
MRARNGNTAHGETPRLSMTKARMLMLFPGAEQVRCPQIGRFCDLRRTRTCQYLNR